MSILNELMLEDLTRWCLPENIEKNREYWSVSGDIVEIFDVMVQGSPDKYGNTMMERQYIGPQGGVIRRLRPYRGRVHLEPLPKNPLTLEDEELARQYIKDNSRDDV